MRIADCGKQELRAAGKSSAVNLVRSDIERGHPRTVDAEYDPQICFDRELA